MPRYYEHSVAKAYGYKYFGDWQELTREQRSDLLAHYFDEILIEAHKNDAVREKSEKDARKRKKKSQ